MKKLHIDENLTSSQSQNCCIEIDSVYTQSTLAPRYQERNESSCCSNKNDEMLRNKLHKKGTVST